jgi:hypothetical protein
MIFSRVSLSPQRFNTSTSAAAGALAAAMISMGSASVLKKSLRRAPLVCSSRGGQEGVTALVGQFPRIAFLLGDADESSRTALPEAAQNAAVCVGRELSRGLPRCSARALRIGISMNEILR